MIEIRTYGDMHSIAADCSSGAILEDSLDSLLEAFGESASEAQLEQADQILLAIMSECERAAGDAGCATSEDEYPASGFGTATGDPATGDPAAGAPAASAPKVIGICTITANPPGEKQIGSAEAVEVKILVSPEHRGQRTGRGLLLDAKAGRDSLVAKVPIQNVRAKSFFEREEFVVESGCVDETTGSFMTVLRWKSEVGSGLTLPEDYEKQLAHIKDEVGVGVFELILEDIKAFSKTDGELGNQPG